VGKVRAPVEQFEHERDAIEDTVAQRGFSVELNSSPQGGLPRNLQRATARLCLWFSFMASRTSEAIA
jgi:hypothetical protein